MYVLGTKVSALGLLETATSQRVLQQTPTQGSLYAAPKNKTYLKFPEATADVKHNGITQSDFHIRTLTT